MGLIWERLGLGIAVLAGIAWGIVALRDPEPVKEKWSWLREQMLRLAIWWQSGMLVPLPRALHYTYRGRHRAVVA